MSRRSRDGIAPRHGASRLARERRITGLLEVVAVMLSDLATDAGVEALPALPARHARHRGASAAPGQLAGRRDLGVGREAHTALALVG